VRGYSIYRNGALVSTVDKNTLSYSDTKLTPATTYAYRVDAFDGSGNHSALSTSRSATTQSTATYTFTPVADAYVAGDFATTNYGRSVSLRADASPVYQSYLRFNVGDLSGTVTNATLRLYTTSSSTTGYQIKQVTSQNWEEGVITYSNAPAMGAVIGSSGSFTAGNWTSVNVTSLITGNGIYDLALTTSSTAALNFNSRDAGSNQPQLVIQTSTSASTPTPTQTATATVTPTTGSGNTLTFTTVADARVVQTSPTTNYGTATTLQADGDAGAAQTSFIRFNATGISGPIQSVKLRVFCTTNGTANGPAAYLANSTWTESGTGGITWNNQPGLLSGAVDNKAAIAASSWVEYDVTSLVTGNGTFTFALVADSSDGIVFSSREGTTPPQLVVTLGTAVSTPTPTATQPSAATNTPTFTPTATAGSGNTLTFTTVADARVVQTSPTMNYGTATTLLIDGDTGAAQTSFIRFDATGIPGPVQNVKLRVFCTTNGTANGPAVYLANSTWTESGAGGINWNNQPALLSSAFDNKGAISASSWVEYDVTSLVTGNGTFTFALVADSSDGITFSSREGTTPAQLVVTLGASGPTSTPTPTATQPSAATNTPTFTPTPTVGSGTALTFTTEADARVAQASPTTNYGAQTNLQVSAAAGSAQNSFIRFTVSGVSGTVQNVKLRVYCTTNGTNNGPAVYLADSNWVEQGTSGITWNAQPVLLSSAFDNKAAIAMESWVEYDVTALVTGDGTYTFALVADGTDGVTFSSREGTSQPQLVVSAGP
jgi:hypothetical protein